MKKVLLLIITLFICSNVSALDIELQIVNQRGVEIREQNETLLIPYQSTVKLVDEMDGKAYASVEYNGKIVSIRKSDLKPIESIVDGTKGTESEGTIKVFEDGISIYSGPSETFYNKLSVVLPKNIELTYNYTYNDYAYVTYEGTNGWILMDLANEKVAKKETSKIMVINPNNIELKDSIKGNKIENPIKAYEVLDYDYITKYQYNIKYNDQYLWLSIIGDDAIATVPTIENISLNTGDRLYEQPNTEKEVYEIKATSTIKPLFYYNDFYYIEVDNIKGWIKPANVIGDETSTKVELTEKEVITPGVVEEEPVEIDNKKIPTKAELIIIVGLAVVLLLSLTSLIAVVIMNKKNGNTLQKNIDESNNSDKVN